MKEKKNWRKRVANLPRMFTFVKLKKKASIGIGLKNSYFPVIRLPSCYRTVYRTVQQADHIQSCRLNQPITTLVSMTKETVPRLLNWGFFKNGEFFFLLEQLSFLWLIGDSNKSILLLLVWFSTELDSTGSHCHTGFRSMSAI